MEKFLRNIEKVVTKAMNSLDGKVDKIAVDIVDHENKLRDLKNERTIISAFLDKLGRILAILKE